MCLASGDQTGSLASPPCTTFVSGRRVPPVGGNAWILPSVAKIRSPVAPPVGAPAAPGAQAAGSTSNGAARRASVSLRRTGFFEATLLESGRPTKATGEWRSLVARSVRDAE